MTKTTKLFFDVVTKRLRRYELLGVNEMWQKGLIRDAIFDVVREVHIATIDAILDENKDVSFEKEHVLEGCQEEDNAIGHLYNIKKQMVLNIIHPLVVDFYTREHGGKK